MIELLFWWTGSPRQWAILGLLFGLGAVIALSLLAGGSSKTPLERADDDDIEQAKQVRHVRAGSTWMGD